MAIADDRFQLIDLREQPDLKLLRRFYKKLMVPHFPIADELEPLACWEEMLSMSQRHRDGQMVWHLLLAFDRQDTRRKQILGGSAFEFYPQSDCGLLTYIVIDPAYRRHGLSGVLTTSSIEILAQDAQNHGHADCQAIFVEMNLPDRVATQDDALDPTLRLKIFQKMGFRKLSFDYIQPPLSPGQQKCKSLLLAIYPTLQQQQRPVVAISSTVICNFLHEFYATLCADGFTEDPDYLYMIAQLRRVESVKIADLV